MKQHFLTLVSNCKHLDKLFFRKAVCLQERYSLEAIKAVGAQQLYCWISYSDVKLQELAFENVALRNSAACPRAA